MHIPVRRVLHIQHKPHRRPRIDELHNRVLTHSAATVAWLGVQGLIEGKSLAAHPARGGSGAPSPCSAPCHSWRPQCAAHSRLASARGCTKCQHADTAGCHLSAPHSNSVLSPLLIARLKQIIWHHLNGARVSPLHSLTWVQSGAHVAQFSPESHTPSPQYGLVGWEAATRCVEPEARAEGPA